MRAVSADQANTPSGAVFLSYASQDAEAAQKICEALRAAGIEVFLDQSELRGGDVWDERIRREIHDCALFIPVISANTASRREGYFRLEWDLADQRSHMMARTRVFVVPVCLDATTEAAADVPESFRRAQWTRLPAGETPPAFVERVRRLLSPETPAATRPLAGTMSGAISAVREPIRASRWAKPLLLAIVAVVALAALAYVVANKFWVSKQATTEAAPAPAAAAAFNPPPHSIAVLPFVDLSEKHDQEYFADGMSEAVLDLLANIPGLKVIGRTSSFQFKGKNQDLRAVGSTLGARYVVEGSVRKSGDQVRVTAQLINADDGSHLWSDTYDEKVDDALKIQDKIAANLARALQVSVGADYQQARPSFKTAEQYDLYLRGRHAIDRWDKEGLESAVTYFQQVLELDPNSAPAAAWLSAAQEAQAEFGYVEVRDGMERARSSAQRALKLDPNSREGYIILGVVQYVYDWDWPAAERSLKEAARLAPRDPIVIANLGQLYEALGKWDDSSRALETALTRDPLFTIAHEALFSVRLATGRLREAEAEARRVLQISPTYAEAQYYLGTVLLLQGKSDAALIAMQQETQEGAHNVGLAMVYYAMGRRGESDAALSRAVKEHGQDDASEIADAYAYRGEKDLAFKWLEQACAQKDTGLWGIKGDPFLKDVQNDPRYKALLRKMNFTE